MGVDTIVKFDSVTKVYNTHHEFTALRAATFEIYRGNFVAIMGPSGSGKSTLLNLIAGLDTPTSGSVWIDGIDLTSLNDNERTRLRREKIGMIFQTFNLLPTLSALENVSLPLRLKGISQKESESRAEKMLTRVDLGERQSYLPDQMSGGERQRVAIARALVFEPQLLLADEPTGNLDSKTGESILNKLKNLHESFETTIILVTHDEFAAGYCNRIVELKDGVIVNNDT